MVTHVQFQRNDFGKPRATPPMLHLAVEHSAWFIVVPKSRVLANAPIHSLTILIQTVVFMGKPLGLKVTFMLT